MRSTSLEGLPTDTTSGANGSVRFAIAQGALVAQTVRPDAGRSTTHVLLRRPSALGYGEAAFTSTGGAVATFTQVGRRAVLRAVDVDARGTVGAPQTLSSPNVRVLTRGPIEVGPTGAVAIPFDEQPTHDQHVERFAFRPQGSRTFNPSIELKPGSDHSPTGFQVYLDGDGGGMLL
ncbi:MAG: hypothetical protein AAGC46_21000, partial [Solirubrobacteraceae bacterium]